MELAEGLWAKFEIHAASAQKLRAGPRGTIADTLRKLRYCLSHGVQLDPPHIDSAHRFIAWHQSTGASNNATNHYIKALNRWWFFQTGEKPFRAFSTPRFAPRHWPSDEEVQRLLRTSLGRSRACKTLSMCIKLALYSGLRISEVCSLEMDDIDFERSVVQVRAGKGNKFREVPLEDHVLRGHTNLCLENYLQHHRHSSHQTGLFTTEKGRLTPNYLRNRFKIVARRAGLSWMRFHDLRHWRAVRWMRDGIDIYTLQRLLGHEALTSTQVYLHANRNDLRRAIAEHPTGDLLHPHFKIK